MNATSNQNLVCPQGMALASVEVDQVWDRVPAPLYQVEMSFTALAPAVTAAHGWLREPRSMVALLAQQLMNMGLLMQHLRLAAMTAATTLVTAARLALTKVTPLTGLLWPLEKRTGALDLLAATTALSQSSATCLIWNQCTPSALVHATNEEEQCLLKPATPQESQFSRPCHWPDMVKPLCQKAVLLTCQPRLASEPHTGEAQLGQTTICS